MTGEPDYVERSHDPCARFGSSSRRSSRSPFLRIGSTRLLIAPSRVSETSRSMPSSLSSHSAGHGSSCAGTPRRETQRALDRSLPRPLVHEAEAAAASGPSPDPFFASREPLHFADSPSAAVFARVIFSRPPRCRCACNSPSGLHGVDARLPESLCVHRTARGRGPSDDLVAQPGWPSPRFEPWRRSGARFEVAIHAICHTNIL
jgi:hypothetical protein